MRSLWIEGVRRAATLAVVALAVAPVTGCLLLGEDLTRLPPAEQVLSACNFDIVDAYRCEGYKSTYYVEGLCAVNGLYLIEGSLTWRAEDGKVAESYSVEPLPLPPPKYGAGEILFTARCDAEPYRAGSSANCLDPRFNTTISSLPMALVDLVSEAKPIAVGQFSEGDLAPFPVQTGCKPEQPMPKRPRPRPELKPECESERAPALLVVSPANNELFDALEVDSFDLALAPTGRERIESVEIEWEVLNGRFHSVDNLPTMVPWASFPLTIALDQGRGGVPGAFYRVRVRPHDTSCPRAWSMWRTFRTVHALAAPAERGAG